MINRDKLEHILEYARQQRHIGQSCKVPPEDMVEIMERLLSACNSPAIPDGWTCNDKANAALMMLDRIETADPVDDDRIDGIKRIVSELVAATQPQNAPQNIPEIISGWIPVSERMPEDRTQVILWDAEIGEVTSGHYSHKTHTFYHCGDAIENEITHWMAPPAAPQEVKGE
ncbi:Eaa1 [Klebsiella variicola]|nr:Eaa1 [Klebsiella variicola]